MIRLLIQLLLASKAYASDSNHYLITQSGGYVGFSSGGVGTTIGNYDTSALIGYVPALVGGEELWQFTWKNSLRYSVQIDQTRLVHFYSGINLLLSFDKDTFWLLPKHYPKGYYPPTGAHAAPSFGAETSFDKHNIYLELTTLDYYAEAYVRNPNYLSPQKIFTYGIGYKLLLQ